MEEEHEPPFREMHFARDEFAQLIRRVQPFVIPPAMLPPDCAVGAPEVLPGLVMAVAIQTGNELGFLPADTLNKMFRAEWVRLTAIANLQALPPPRIDRIQAAEGRTDSDILLLRSKDPFGASRISYLGALVKWASGGERAPLGVLVSIPTWHLMMLHVLSGPGVAKVLERMAVTGQIEFAEARQHTGVSPDVFFVAPDGRKQTVAQRGGTDLVIETRGLIGEFLFGPHGAYKDIKPANG
jgi:hypothetical protein